MELQNVLKHNPNGCAESSILAATSPCVLCLSARIFSKFHSRCHQRLLQVTTQEVAAITTAALKLKGDDQGAVTNPSYPLVN
jgi:hypothetical protein